MRRFIAVSVAFVLVAMMAVPAMAAPGIKFSARLQVGNPDVTIDNQRETTVPGTGTAADPYRITLGGQPGLMRTVQLINVKVQPKPLPFDTRDSFYLKSSTANLTAYFAAKGWPQDYLDQITREIAGTAPFFTMIVGAGNGWFLSDGFHEGLGCDVSTSPYCFEPGMYPLQMDDDYPVGTYTYTGVLLGQNQTSVAYTFVMKVVRG